MTIFGLQADTIKESKASIKNDVKRVLVFMIRSLGGLPKLRTVPKVSLETLLIISNLRDVLCKLSYMNKDGCYL